MSQITHTKVPVGDDIPGYEVNFTDWKADHDLHGESLVPGTPGGELGGTWDSPTVDATHSGSSHAATQAAAESTAATALSGHTAAADPHPGYLTQAEGDAAYDALGAAAAAQAASQPLDSDLTAFAGLAIAADKLPYGTGSHTLGLADLTAAGRAILDDADAPAQRTTLGLGTLATQSGTFSGTSSGTNTGDQTLPVGGTPAVVLGSSASAGTSPDFLRRDDTIAAFDATAPTTSALADAAATGSAAKAARRDHVHGRESFGASAAAIGNSSAGAATTPSRSDHVHATGAGTPSTQAFGDAAATGSGPAAAMTDHKHAMMSAPTSVSGNAGTATALQNARTINGVSFDGTANIVTTGAGFFGDGSDGSTTLQQSTSAPAWASKSGAGSSTLFTLSRDVYFTTADFDDSAGNYLVKTNGYRIFASTSLTIDAGVTVHDDGNAGVADAAGGNTNTGTITGAVGAGSAGGANTTATQATAVPNTMGGAGGVGGAATGGGTGGGVAGGTATPPVASSGSPRNLVQAHNLTRAGASTLINGGGGGTGGNSTGGATAKGGGGGAGAGICAIYAKLLTNNGIIRAQGGAGGNGTAGNGTGSGGGAGGGGGFVILVYGSGSTTGTITVTGGGGGSGTGTGATGGTGVSGASTLFAL